MLMPSPDGTDSMIWLTTLPRGFRTVAEPSGAQPAPPIRSFNVFIAPPVHAPAGTTTAPITLQHLYDVNIHTVLAAIEQAPAKAGKEGKPGPHRAICSVDNAGPPAAVAVNSLDSLGRLWESTDSHRVLCCCRSRGCRPWACTPSVHSFPSCDVRGSLLLVGVSRIERGLGDPGVGAVCVWVLDHTRMLGSASHGAAASLQPCLSNAFVASPRRKKVDTPSRVHHNGTTSEREESKGPTPEPRLTHDCDPATVEARALVRPASVPLPGAPSILC